MGKFRIGRSRTQVSFLPPSIDEYVPEDDAVRFIDALINEFDLGEIEASYSSLGRPAFSPVVLTKLILYGKIRGIRSCRELARAARENVKFMYLMNDEKPDFRTINSFRKRFRTELSGLLAQTVQIGMKEGLISLDLVTVDSTKLKGYASKKSYQDPEYLEKLVKAIDLSFENDINADDDTDDDDTPKLPPSLQDRKKLRAKVKAALSTYREMELPERQNKAPKTISLTDPECRYMQGPGIAIRGYNLQAAVDAKNRFVVAGYATNTSDNRQLISMVDEIEKNTGKLPDELAADGGYSDHGGLRLLKEKNIVAFVPLRKDFKLNRKHGRTSIEDYQAAQEMYWRIRSPVGQKRKIDRSSTIETLFGHLKHARHLDRLYMRGKSMIDSFWKLELAAVNIEKLIRFRMRKMFA